jgi:hypothetical protein
VKENVRRNVRNKKGRRMWEVQQGREKVWRESDIEGKWGENVREHMGDKKGKWMWEVGEGM